MEGTAIKTQNTDVLESMTAEQVSCWKWFISFNEREAIENSHVYLVACGTWPSLDLEWYRILEKFKTERDAFPICEIVYRHISWNSALFVKINEEGVCEPLSPMLFAQSIISNWELKSLQDPELLEQLNLSGLSLKELPPLPANLEYLRCECNRLTTLPDLPANLQILTCGNNALTTLPKLPGGVYYLQCERNNLTELPSLPSVLHKLYCSENLLTHLPPLPKTLDTLNCAYNKLEILPNLPNTLKHLNCKNNQLITIPEFDGEKLYTEGNPDLPLSCNTVKQEVVRSFMKDLRKAEAEVERVRIVSRCTAIKEELMADRCAPQRVEQLLAQGLGLEEALEMLGLGAE
jgi:Leucine-rich repeat (LRR) protein